jgi:hypothetical protein
MPLEPSWYIMDNLPNSSKKDLLPDFQAFLLLFLHSGFYRLQEEAHGNSHNRDCRAYPFVNLAPFP